MYKNIFRIHIINKLNLSLILRGLATDSSNRILDRIIDLIQ